MQTQETLLGFEDEVSAVVLDDVLQQYATDAEAEYEAFISVSKKDPSSNLLAKLRIKWPRIRIVSESYIDAQSADSVKDKQTKKRGIMYWVNRIKRLDERNAEAAAGYYSSNLGGEECTYLLHRESEAWMIVGKLHCLSS